ncbi:DUF421 domain-containing protein [Clostridium septicum]|uniref:DUF421 domain-containing protein n=1 Tax=Clostridium septicum TaxID=1504 RepID=A0A9N7PL20_CLOSE|nr:DUF421 domain-containing protein [Clostridium septicum]AYE34857.1 DUF421 domain-containing protein [Clostridium septicum]MDU1313327.1 DUF421 domain-containing protein [Clostridium septicum]QAS60251.1 DUF421 domain-containing protein [Clostridium septicum]UEC20493.1 DUF421 domain-containing protein [Clostridium septicum]USS01451.1 DUF421 domain-containing protein [Clostridium septicum]
MFIVLIRTIILYALVVFVMRLMGKRQIGELQPYEFVITIMISDLAALPMQDTRLPLILGVIPIITLLFVKTLLTQLQLKSQLARKIIEGEPSILICRGKVNFSALKKQQINLDELMEELRLAGYFDLSEIEYAILENNGQLSFLTSQSSSSSSNSTDCSNTQSNSNGNSSDQTNTSNSNKSNSSKNQSKPRLPIIYVLDGEVNNNALTSSGKNKVWVKNELKKHKIDSIDKVLLAMTDTTGKFIYQLYDDYEKGCKQ